MTLLEKCAKRVSATEARGYLMPDARGTQAIDQPSDAPKTIQVPPDVDAHQSHRI